MVIGLEKLVCLITTVRLGLVLSAGLPITCTSSIAYSFLEYQIACKYDAVYYQSAGEKDNSLVLCCTSNIFKIQSYLHEDHTACFPRDPFFRVNLHREAFLSMLIASEVVCEGQTEGLLAASRRNPQH